MSGRTRVTLADGRRVIGFRKTLRKQTRQPPSLPPHRLADWVLSFELPLEIGLGLTPGFYPGVIGLCIWPTGHVSIAGKNRDWLLDQLRGFLVKEAPHGLIRALPVNLRCGSEPGPTLSGPLRRAMAFVDQVTWDGHTMHARASGTVRSERVIEDARGRRGADTAGQRGCGR